MSSTVELIGKTPSQTSSVTLISTSGPGNEAKFMVFNQPCYNDRCPRQTCAKTDYVNFLICQLVHNLLANFVLPAAGQSICSLIFY